MSVLNKLALILVLSLTVLGVGGYFFYNEITGGDTSGLGSLLTISGLPEDSYAVIPRADIDKKGVSRMKAGSLSDRTEQNGQSHSSDVNSLLPTDLGDMHSSLKTKSSVSHVKPRTDGSETYLLDNGGASAGISPSLSTFSSSGSSFRNSQTNEGSALAANSVAMKPFGAPSPSGNTGVVFVDPSTDPVNFIPVGDSVWILILLVFSYALLKIRRFL